MCHKPVDSLPLDRSIFSGHWLGIALGVLIVVGLVVGFNRYLQNDAAAVAQITRTATSTATHTPRYTATPTSTGTPTSTPTVTPTPTATPRVHIIQSGDTMLFISQRYGVPLNVLFSFNNITEEDVLNVGQEILIPPALNDTGQPLPGGERPPQMVYVIQSGDTILDIAIEQGTTIEDIERANPDLDLDVIFPGQEIIVPLSTPTPTNTPTPLPTSTFTPGPDFPAPQLLAPANGAVLDQSTVLLNWASPRLLADNEFYVVRIDWANGVRTSTWLRGNSMRLKKDERPASGILSWSVAIVRQTGTSADGNPVGRTLSPVGPVRSFEWP
jgi:LysM repeat protein